MTLRARVAAVAPAGKPAEVAADSSMNLAMRRTWLDLLNDAVTYARWLANRQSGGPARL
jgi:hypothetical protein